MSAKYTFLAWDTPIKEASTKLVMLQLANNANDNGFSYYSIAKMANACGMSERTFMRKIQKLEEMGFLNVERRANRSSLYTLIGKNMGVTDCHLQESEVTDCHVGVTNCHGQGDRLSHDPNSVPKTNPKSSRFTPPTEEQVFEYMQERDFAHSKESEAFVNFYESKGWLVGKSKMKDWKAAVRNWISRSNLPKTTQHNPQQQQYDHEAARQREIEEIRKGLM